MLYIWCHIIQLNFKNYCLVLNGVLLVQAHHILNFKSLQQKVAILVNIQFKKFYIRTFISLAMGLVLNLSIQQC